MISKQISFKPAMPPKNNITKDEALRMAIEALGNVSSKITKWTNGGNWLNGEKAINACKAALQEDALDRMAENARELGLDYDVKCSDHPDAPHGFCRNTSHSAGRYVCECEGWEAERKRSEQAPVAEVTSQTGADITMSWWHEPALPIGTKLYTRPTKKLSDNEIALLWANNAVPLVGKDYLKITRAIEDKLLEINNGNNT